MASDKHSIQYGLMRNGYCVFIKFHNYVPRNAVISIIIATKFSNGR